MARLFTSANSDNIGAAITFAQVPFSMACWFKVSAFPGVQQAVYSTSSTTVFRYYVLLFNTTGHLLANVNDGTTNAAATSGVAAANVWHHAAGVFNGTTVVVYLDGVGTSTSTSGFSGPTVNWIAAAGLAGPAGPGYFDGTLAECGMWFAELSVNEVKGLAGGLPPSRLRTQNLLSYWPLWGLSPEPNLSGQGSAINGSVLGSPAPTVVNHAPVGSYAPQPRFAIRDTNPVPPSSGTRHHRLARSWFG